MKIAQTRLSAVNVKNITLAAAAAFIGMTGLTSAPSMAVLVLAVPVLWTLADSRYAALAVMFAYNLTVSRGLFRGAAVFLSENHTAVEAVCLWLLMVFAVSLPFGLFWSRKNGRKAALLVLAFVVAYILPPFSLVGIVNPLMASGCLFSGWGFGGLAAMMVIYVLCAVSKRIGAAFLCCAALLPFMPFSPVETPQALSGFAAVNTSFGKLGSGSFNFAQDFERANFVFGELRNRQFQDNAKVIVLPETIAGRLNDTGLALWREEIQKLLPGKTVIFGAELPAGDGRKYDNAAVMLHDGQISAVYQRIPVPYSMYAGPFAETGANLHLWDDGIFSLPLPDGRKAAVIVCYEAFLTWPYLASMAHSPDVVIVLANLWWCRETSLPLTMERAVSLWALTFGVPAVFALNI